MRRAKPKPSNQQPIVAPPPPFLVWRDGATKPGGAYFTEGEARRAASRIAMKFPGMGIYVCSLVPAEVFRTSVAARPVVAADLRAQP